MAFVVALGDALWLQHKHAEADQLYDRWLQAAEAAWGRVDSRVINLIHRMIYRINQRARSFLGTGKTPEAQSMYGRALTLAEKLPEGYDRATLLGLGKLYGELGRHEEAEKLLRRCWSREDSSDTEVAEALGAVLRRTGREKEAEEIEEHARRHHWYLNP
jgi:tetratricopeptide (TPR) repeat protein